MKNFTLLAMLALFIWAMLSVALLLTGCKSARWCEGDPLLTPTASGPPVVLERIEIGVGTSVSGSVK